MNTVYLCLVLDTTSVPPGIIGAEIHESNPLQVITNKNRSLVPIMHMSSDSSMRETRAGMYRYVHSHTRFAWVKPLLRMHNNKARPEREQHPFVEHAISFIDNYIYENGMLFFEDGMFVDLEFPEEDMVTLSPPELTEIFLDILNAHPLAENYIWNCLDILSELGRDEWMNEILTNSRLREIYDGQ